MGLKYKSFLNLFLSFLDETFDINKCVFEALTRRRNGVCDGAVLGEQIKHL